MYKKKFIFNRIGYDSTIRQFLLAMKFTVLLSFLTFLQVRASTYGQKRSISFNNASIEEALKETKSQTKYDFLNKEILKVNKPIKMGLNDVSMKEVVNQSFKGQQISNAIVQNPVLLKDNLVSNPIVNRLASIVSGKITDEKGLPIPGVSIKIKDTTIGTQTDKNGEYQIKVPDKNAVLIYSFVGFITQEKRVGDAETFNIVLMDDKKNLNEVVVIGYGTIKRKDFTGAVSSVKMEDSPLALLPNNNALQALQGNVAGLNISTTNDAGGQPSVQVRGQNSIKGNNAPLIIVDGVIFLGDLGDINPNDIASYDILKDAVASAAYGSRSANGVIAITLKKGRTSKPNFSFNASTAIQNWQNKPKILGGSEWIDLVNAANTYAPGSTYWLKPQEVANMNAGNEIDWLSKVTRTGVLQSSQIAVSGVSNGLNYYLSTSYDKNKGIVVNDDYNRISVLGKISVNVNKWLQLGMDGNFAKRDYSGITPNIHTAEIMSPYGSVYRDDQGNLEKYPTEQGSSFVNPLWGVNDGLRDNADKRQDYRLNSYALLTAPWIQGLTYRLNFTNNLTTRKNDAFNHEGYFVGEGAVTNTARYSPATIQNYLVLASGQTDNFNNYSYVLDNILNYNHLFGKHNLDVTAVATRDNSKNDQQTINGTNYASNGNTTLGVGGLAYATTQTINLNSLETANVGYLGRVNYSFNEKYFLNALIRRDGASVFGLDRKWGNFGAVGVAWLITNEEFFKNIKGLNRLKLKASWGQNGNQGVGAYSTLAKVTNGVSSGVRYQFSNTGSLINYGLLQGNLANAALGWESTEKWNTGLESAWLNNRLFVDFDIYSSKTTNEIYTPTIPSPTGFSSITSSLGEVHNKGLELTLRSVNIKSPTLDWSTAVTYWLNRNKLVHINRQDLNHDGIEDDRIADGLFIGQPLNAIYGYVQDGIVQPSDVAYKSMPGASTIDGYPKYNDINGDGQITPADRKILGYPQENFRLNISNSVTYKNFELYAMVTGVFGGNGYYLKSNPQAYQSTTGDGFNTNMTYRPYWTVNNLSNVYPAAFFKSDGGKFLGLQSRTFVRVQNITLSYSVPKSWLAKYKFTSFKLFCNANNPFVTSKWVGADPEVGSALLGNSKPVASTYSIGLSTNF
jgi:TonB-linked SusC/RagA family outer membrane protein